MVTPVDTANVYLWDMLVGRVFWDANRLIGVFEYSDDFVRIALPVSPLHMPVRRQFNYEFTGLERNTFQGLPGLLADSLPDKFGGKILDAWLSAQNRPKTSFSPIEHLCYIGTRGMGALEFRPVKNGFDRVVDVDLNSMVGLINDINLSRRSLSTHLSEDEQVKEDSLKSILRVGASAGGARAKAVIAMNDKGHIVSGQSKAPPGYEHFLLKFDGIVSAPEAMMSDSHGFGRIEYAYHLMAHDAGIHMMPCHLIEENGRAHFVTKRFDRVNGEKLHMQTLCGLAHFDFNVAGAHSYEQVFGVMRALNLPHAAALELYRRMLFNVIARNQDDHPKNISFLMDRRGIWSLSPAYDVTYSYDPQGRWTAQHQMWLAGKRDDFSLDDLVSVGESIRAPNPKKIIEKIVSVVADWPRYAKVAGVCDEHRDAIQKTHRLYLGRMPIKG